MVGVSSCAVPGCCYRYGRSNSEKRSIFTIYRPDLGKNEQEKSHRQMLTNFILSMRDAKSPTDTILTQLHKESAGICAIHFDKESIEIIGKRRRLKLGAKPCYNLPKSSMFFQTPQRKPPAVRPRYQFETIQHKTLKDVRQSYRRLNPTLQEKWKIIRNTTTFELIGQEQNILIPRFKITLKEDVGVDCFEIYGWQVQFPILHMTNLNVTTLHAFLDKFEKLKICNGIEARENLQGAVNHPILIRKNSKVVVCNTFHSINCAIYCDNQELDRCSGCGILQSFSNQENASSFETQKVIVEKLIKVES